MVTLRVESSVQESVDVDALGCCVCVPFSCIVTRGVTRSHIVLD